MKAIIVGAPIQIDGEPAEIAALVELLTSGKVAIEHVHRWRIGELDGSATVRGSCWCGVEKDFNPQLPSGSPLTSAVKAKRAEAVELGPPRVVARPEALAKRAKKVARRCRLCGEAGHNARNCPATED